MTKGEWFLNLSIRVSNILTILQAMSSDSVCWKNFPFLMMVCFSFVLIIRTTYRKKLPVSSFSWSFLKKLLHPYRSPSPFYGFKKKRIVQHGRGGGFFQYQIWFLSFSNYIGLRAWANRGVPPMFYIINYWLVKSQKNLKPKKIRAILNFRWLRIIL